MSFLQRNTIHLQKSGPPTAFAMDELPQTF